MLGTKIVMDEDKIIKEKRYDLNKIYKILDDTAYNFSFIKQDKFTYIAKDDEESLSNMGRFCFDTLMNSKWFIENVKEWLFLDSEEGNSDMMVEIKKAI